jgi:hypothetical protein
MTKAELHLVVNDDSSSQIRARTIWEAARDETRDAYHHWMTVEHEQKSPAYAVYVAARDREDAAADAYARAAAA